MPKSEPQEATVEPLESVQEAPKNNDNNELCWNCKAQDKKTKNRLNSDGICTFCGFDKSLVYNGNLEAEKAQQKG